MKDNVKQFVMGWASLSGSFKILYDVIFDNMNGETLTGGHTDWDELTKKHRLKRHWAYRNWPYTK